MTKMKPINMIKKFNFLSLFTAMLLLLGAHSAFAVKVYVTNTNPSGAGSLPDVILNSNNGDTIIINVAGTLNLSSQMDVTKDVVIIGPGPIHFKISYSALASGIPAIKASNSGTMEIHGVGFIGGQNGHAILTPTGYAGLCHLESCLFEANLNSVLFIDGGKLEVFGSSFIDNSSQNAGGACYFNGAMGKFVNCTFNSNEAANSGGAIEMSAGAGQLDLVHCTFLENGVTMGGASEGKAISVKGGILNLRNNIIERSTGAGSVNTIITTVGGTIVTQGGNVTNDSGDFSPLGNDFVNTVITMAPMVTDGWGLKYFPYADNATQGIDVATDLSNLPKFDQRRVWRVMDAGNTNLYADAGAVEYTPLVVNQTGSSGPNTLNTLAASVYPGLSGKKAFVFEFIGTGPFNCPVSGVTLGADSTIVNGFSQDSSVVPGPGSTLGTVSPGYMPIFVPGSSFVGFSVSGQGVIIAGMTMNSFNGGRATAINVSGTDAEISGCHIGVDPWGTNAIPNNIGIRVAYNGSAKIGSGRYCGEIYHANRNVIAGNTDDQIIITGSATSVIQSNFIGLASDGLSVPTSAPSTADTGIAVIYYSASSGVNIGGDQPWKGNVIADMDCGIYLLSSNNTVLSNKIGVDHTGNAAVSGATGVNGIEVTSGSSYNLIGIPGAGNIIGSYKDGIVLNNSSYSEVYSNLIGVSADTSIAIGNTLNGILVTTSNNNLIGGCVSGEGNIIGNNDVGIKYQGGGGAFYDSIKGNYIGTTPGGMAIGNATAGISFTSNTTQLQIGDALNSGCANEITNNGVGVLTDQSGNNGILISGNSFHDNVGIGIDLDGNGANSTGSSSAPYDNNYSETPLLLTAVDCGSGVNLSIQLDFGGNAMVEVFESSDGEEGTTFITQQLVSFVSGTPQIIPLGAITPGTSIVATVSYDDGSGNYRNTSEFGGPVTVTAGTPPAVSITGQDSLCAWSTETLSATFVSGASYLWYFPDPLYDTTSTSNYSGASIIGSNISQTITMGDNGEPFGGYDTLIVEVNDAGCIVRDTMIHYLLIPQDIMKDSLIYIDTCGATGAIYLQTYEPNSTFTVYYQKDLVNQTFTTTTDGSSNGWFPLEGLPAGNYIIDSISNGLCSSYIYSANDTFDLYDPTPPTATAGADFTICEGDFATLSAYGAGGSGSYEFSWDNGAGTGANPSVTPFVTTMYTVTVKDVESRCTATAVQTVNVSPLPLISISSPTVGCDGVGYQYMATVTSGTPGYTYSWTSASEFVDASVEDAMTVPLAAGTYNHTLTVTDVNGCFNTQTATLTVNPIPTAGSGVNNVGCYGGNDGSIILSTGGSYSYSWTGPSFSATTQDVSGLSAGTYNVTMTDADGCSGTLSTVVLQPASLPGFVSATTDPICFGDPSGSIIITDTAGVSTFQYSIDGGSTWQASGTFSGLVAGSYTCSLMDGNGCMATDETVNLIDPVALSFTTVKFDDTCSLGKGEIQFSATGGTSPYNYSIDGGVTYVSTPTFTGLMNGGYDLYLQDGMGCQTSIYTTLNDQSGVSLAVSSYSPQVSCFDSFDGFINTLVTNPFGGSVSYNWSYNASPGYATTQNISNLYGGDYELIATDMGGCKDTLPVTITTPAQMFITAIPSPESCSGYNDGQLDVGSVTGGTAPYNYEWFSIPSNTSVGTSVPQTGLGTGDYKGVVTDNMGCVASDTVTITAGETYNPAVIVMWTDTCLGTNSFDFGDDSGAPVSGAASINWVFTNGSPATSTVAMPSGIQFTWTGLQEVRYVVTSNAGCTYYDTIWTPMIVDTPTVALVPTDISCFGLNDGVVNASISGGFGPYDYYFNGNLSANTTNTGLAAGTYTGYAVDQTTGCQSAVHNVGIAEPSQITFTAVISDATCGNSNGQVDFQSVTGGISGYTYSVDGSNYVSTNPITGLAPATYSFYVQDANGCIGTQNSNTIANNGNPVPTPTIPEGSPFIICDDGSGNYGLLSAVSNDVSPGTFEWSMVSVGNVISANDTLFLDALNTGNHYIYLVESNGTCTSSPDSVLLSLTASDVVNNAITEVCLGNQASIDLTTSGTILWLNSNGEIADTTALLTSVLPTVLPSTYYYEVTIGDCIFYDSITLVEDPDCDVITIVNNAFTPNGDGVNDLFIIDANALLSNENRVMIVNRWGDVIREFTNYDNMEVAWDGTNNNGDQMPAGTYFYIVEIPTLEFKSTGWIQVVR